MVFNSGIDNFILDSLPARFFARASAHKNHILYSQFVRSDSHSEEFTLLERNYEQIAQRVQIISSFLRYSGLQAGDAVGIISATRPEWLEADLAIMAAGGVVVSLYPSLIESEVAYLLFDSKAEIVFVENKEQLEKVLKILDRDNLIPASEDRPASTQRIKVKQIISFEETLEHPLVRTFSSLMASGDSEFPQFDHNWYQSRSADSLASLVYTSGTTGPQKGVMQTHRNHLVNLRQAHDGGLYRLDSTIFLLLPLAHSFAKLMGYIGFIVGIKLQFPSISDTASSRANQRRMLLDLSQCCCSLIPLVPRILEKMKEGIELQASKKTLKGWILRTTLLAAARKREKRWQPVVGLLYFLTAAIRNSIKRKLFGSCFEYVISGGAKLAPEVNRFFDSINIEVLEGYGLTETCVATNCNRPGAKRIGTVGPVLAPDIELKLAEDGEILFRGPNVALGYWNQPTATKKAWDSDGWFHSGDLGQIDAAGVLSISGRKKEIIVTSGGKKISPDKLEAALKQHELLSQAMIVGDGRPYCVAFVTPNKERFESLLPSLEVASLNEAMRHADVMTRLDSHLKSVNDQLASFESIKRIMLLKQEFSAENGFLTPTLKMRRGPILKFYESEVDRLYRVSESVLVEDSGPESKLKTSA